MKKKLVSAGVGIVFCLLAARPAVARDFATIYVECGLGALIAPRTPVVAVITNITWDLGTTAISSEMSSPESCKGESVGTASFIHDSYDLLEMDLASGAGTHLDMLATLVGLDTDSAARTEFVGALRADFASYVANSDYGLQNRFQKAEALYNMVYAHASS